MKNYSLWGCKSTGLQLQLVIQMVSSIHWIHVSLCDDMSYGVCVNDVDIWVHSYPVGAMTPFGSSKRTAASRLRVDNFVHGSGAVVGSGGLGFSDP